MKNFRAKIYIIIPAFNEEKTIGKLIKLLKKAGYQNLVVVNDCSSDNTEKIAQKSGAIVLTHIINRGLGGALRTGFAYTISKNADIVITMDADLQHRIENIPNLVKPIIEKKADAVIGKRKFSSRKMPFNRKLANLIGNIFTKIFFGFTSADSQSGFRAFDGRALKKLKLYSNRMEISSEIIAEIHRNHLRFLEIPISTIYTKYSLSKGQSFKNGLKTLARLIAVRLR